MIVDVIQKDRLKEQKLQFIRNHQQAFDVEPIYPLPLFEDFVMSVEGDCSLEVSCKIESDKLIASRFLLFFKDYFNGKSEIEIYAEVQEDDFFKPEINNLVWQHFPKTALEPLKASNLFFTGLSKANNNPVLYYHLKNRQDLTNYFKLNDTAQRVHSFYQNQDILPQMWVGTAQKELEKTRIENIRLYYYKSFKMESN
jgi:Family of unknown function (DUF5838)